MNKIVLTEHGGLTEWLRSSPGKRVRLRRPRGFESHALRQQKTKVYALVFLQNNLTENDLPNLKDQISVALKDIQTDE